MSEKNDTISHDRKPLDNFRGRVLCSMIRPDTKAPSVLCGQLADIQICKRTEKAWGSYRLNENPVGSLGITEASEMPPTDDRSRRPDDSASRCTYLRLISAAVCVWVFLNVLFILWREPYARERQYLLTLQNVVAEVDELRDKAASQKEWHEMAIRTHNKLLPMVADLQKSASVTTLPRQQLLWCARDLVPQIIGPPANEGRKQEARLKHYLIRAEQNLNGVAHSQ